MSDLVKAEYAPAGKSLFRFFRPNTPVFHDTLEHLMLKSELYLASRKNFNDPYDMNPILKMDWTTSKIREHMKNIAANPSRSSLSTPEIARYALSTPSKIPNSILSTKSIRDFKEQFYQYMPGLLDKVGVCCFTEEMQSPLFWAHYAVSYSGIFIFLKATGDTAHPFCNCMRVHYSPTRSTVYASQTGAFQTTYSKGDWSYIAQYAFCTKSSDWSVEKEWRWWLPFKAGSYETFTDGALHAIFLGPLASEPTKSMVIELARKSERTFKVFATHLSDTEFRIEIGKRLI
jgi:hypothetical protein